MDAQRNYDRILEVAAQAFEESGAQASLDDIACRAGVGPGTLYRHFPNRESLLAAALDGSRRELARLADELSDAADAGDALRTWLLALARHMGTFGGLPESVAKSLGDDASPLRDSCTLAETSTAILLARAKDAGVVRVDVTPEDLVVIANSLAWAADKSTRSRDELPRVLDIFVAGLRPA